MTYLKYHRFVLGLTQEGLARKAGMSQGGYCLLEKGIKRPSAKQIDNLSAAIGRPKSEVVSKLYNVNPAEMVNPGVFAK